MMEPRRNLLQFLVYSGFFAFSLFLFSCTGVPKEPVNETFDQSPVEILYLPELTPLVLEGDLLQVVATTSIIGDVVAQVGGETISLTTLMRAGQDPHSYEPAVHDLAGVTGTDVIFINGWDLEESLVHDLEQIGDGIPIIPISANIIPLHLGAMHGEGEGEDGHQIGVDPHVWFSIPNVMQWVENVVEVLSSLDPTNSKVYESNAHSYLEELDELQIESMSRLELIPAENRYLVTNHNSFGYFADEYQFTVLGSVIPGFSSMAEPSASELVELIRVMEEHNLCAIFTEMSVSGSMAQTISDELVGCGDLKVLKLYSGAIGIEGTGAESYIGMFRENVNTIIEGLQ